MNAGASVRATEGDKLKRTAIEINHNMRGRSGLLRKRKEKRNRHESGIYGRPLLPLKKKKKKIASFLFL